MMMMMHNFGLDYSNDENEDFSNLTNTILNWHRKECFEDILLTFGLKERSGEDLQAFAKQEEEEKRRLRQKTKNQNEYHMDVEDYLQPTSDNEDNEFESTDFFETDMSHFVKRNTFGIKDGQKFERVTDKASNSKAIYIGIDDEPAVFNALYGIDLKDFNFYHKKYRDFLNELTSNRFSNSSFESLVIVRANIERITNKFDIKSYKIEEMVDKAIMDQLSKANRMQENSIATKQIDTLILHLEKNKKLLQRYFFTLFEEACLRVKKNVNMLADYTSSKDNKSFNGNFSNSHDFGGLNNASKGEIVNKYLVLKVILCWPQFSQIYDLHFNQKTDILDESLNEKVLNWVNNIFLKTLESISNGNEASIYIHLMKCHQENFINLLKKIKSIKQVEFYQLLIEIRSVEIKEFENYYMALKRFTTFIRNNRYCNFKAYDEVLDRFL
jgi:hypothetical protein